MDDDVFAALDGAELFDDAAFEELEDDFVSQAVDEDGVLAAAAGDDDGDGGGGSAAWFDYDAHVRKLMDASERNIGWSSGGGVSARLGRAGGAHGDGNDDDEDGDECTDYDGSDNEDDGRAPRPDAEFVNAQFDAALAEYDTSDEEDEEDEDGERSEEEDAAEEGGDDDAPRLGDADDEDAPHLVDLSKLTLHVKPDDGVRNRHPHAHAGMPGFESGGDVSHGVHALELEGNEFVEVPADWSPCVMPSAELDARPRQKPRPTPASRRTTRRGR